MEPPPAKPPPLHTRDPPPPDATVRNLENYSHFFRRLALSLPQVHRPTRDDFLNVANGYWQRARVRFKWFTIKSFRKFNADDISAFVTWFLMSQTLWILIGTWVPSEFHLIFAVLIRPFFYQHHILFCCICYCK
jgi:distribution and morphology protein 31